MYGMNKKLLILFFIYIVLEGALRKWFLPEYNTLLFLFKDILLIIITLSFLLTKRESKEAWSYLSKTDKSIWVIFIYSIVFYGLLVRLDSLTIVGWRYYLVSVPLVVLIPLYFNMDIEKYAYYYLLLSLPVLLLGMYQYFSPSDSIINKYAWFSAADSVATFGDKRARITGTFSFISPFVIYLETILLLGWVILLRSKSKKRVLLIATIIFLILVNIIMTGSRAPVLISTILSIPFIYYYMKLSRQKLGLIVLTIGFLFLSFNYFLDPFNSFAQRSEKAGDTEVRILGALFSPITTISSIDIIGSGLGKTFLGTIEIANKNPDTVFDEVHQDRVGLELGILGYLFISFIKIYFLFQTYLFIKKVNIIELKLWLWFSLTIQLSSMWEIPIFNSIAATFYFTAIGIYYLMRRKHFDISKQKVLVKN